MWLQGTEMTPRLVGQAPHCATRTVSGGLVAPLGTDPIASCSQVAEATLQPAHTSPGPQLLPRLQPATAQPISCSSSFQSIVPAEPRACCAWNGC